MGDGVRALGGMGSGWWMSSWKEEGGRRVSGGASELILVGERGDSLGGTACFGVLLACGS